MNLLSIIADTSVDLQDVVANEPDKVGKVGDGGLVNDELEHGLVLDAVDVEGEGPDGNPDHALAVIEELDGLRVEGEVVGVLKPEVSDSEFSQGWYGLEYARPALLVWIKKAF